MLSAEPVSAGPIELLDVSNSAGSPMAMRRCLVEMFRSGDERIIEHCLPVFRSSFEPAKLKPLLAFIINKGLLGTILVRPDTLTLEQAAALLRAAKAVDPLIEPMLIRRFHDAGEQPLIRLIELLALTSGARAAHLLTQLTRHYNPRIQSKSALLLGGVNPNPEALALQLQHDDARVRANAIESLWGARSPHAVKAFRQATRDTNCRAAANALIGLYMADEPDAVELIIEAATNAQPDLRISAVWAMGRLADARFLPWLGQAMGQQSAALRAYIFQAMRRIRQSRDQASAESNK